MIKSITSSSVDAQKETDMSPILIHEAPNHDAGEIKIILSTCVEKLDIYTHKFTQRIKSLGKGLLNELNNDN